MRYGDFSTLENQHFLYAVEIEKISIDINNNDSYIIALLFTIIERAKHLFWGQPLTLDTVYKKFKMSNVKG